MLAIAFAAVIIAQVERGSIVGTITDKSGSVVPGVEVIVTSESTNTGITVRTDESGITLQSIFCRAATP
ncbi:MAG: carboxypeptidase-like regulatory domain-containing protein [Acidobacteria bacterium]|nr:carboxypeptidase-like regulatory domain-containing protein [Acidobacteriota bacterium]MCI0625344.1 carboxypeptidase-like regulatory domain-containing protein [Acidobacteriota bacterium]MCI0721049.1 carboxypeptidase-like regulatory domain-containing protein [Acidobacteriota bacterium]